MKHLWLLVLIPVVGCSTVAPPTAPSTSVEAVAPVAESPHRAVLSKAALAAMKERTGQALSVVWYGECGDRPVGISCEAETPDGEDISQGGIKIVADSDVMEHLDDLGPLLIDYEGAGNDGWFTVNLSKPLPSNDPAECEECKKKQKASASQKQLVLSDAARKAMKTQPKKCWSVTYNGTCSDGPALGFYPEVEPLSGGVDVSQDGFRIYADPKVSELLDKMGPIVVGCTPAGNDYTFTAEFKNAAKVDDGCPDGSCKLKEPRK